MKNSEVMNVLIQTYYSCARGHENYKLIKKAEMIKEDFEKKELKKRGLNYEQNY